MRFKFLYLKRFAALIAISIVYLLLTRKPHQPDVYIRKPDYSVHYIGNLQTYMFYSKTSTLSDGIEAFNGFLAEKIPELPAQSCGEYCVLPCDRAEYANSAILGRRHPRFKKARAYEVLQHLPSTPHRYKFFNYMRSNVDGLHTFIVNWKTDAFFENDNPSLNKKEATGEYLMSNLPFTNEFYRCVSGDSLRAVGGFHLAATSQTQFQCVHNCSENLGSVRTAVGLADHEFFTDYSRMSYWTTCNYFVNRTIDEHVTMSIQSDILTALDVVTDGGMVHEYGDVFTNSRSWISAFGCGYQSIFRAIKPCNITSTVDHVFVITQKPKAINHYHFLIEQIPRLASFVTFLRANPHIYIHTRNESMRTMPLILKIFQLSNPLTHGYVQAKTIYVPHGGGCLNAHLSSIQLAATHFRHYILHSLTSPGNMEPQGLNLEKPDVARQDTPVVILMKRQSRSLSNHKEVYRMLERYTGPKSFELVIFDDSNLPSMEETMVLFHRAVLVVGPHGAGFSNILYSTPGTMVIDIQCCCSYMRTCYKNLALKLGMRYYAMATTARKALSRRCDLEGVFADLDELSGVLDYTFTHVI